MVKVSETELERVLRHIKNAPISQEPEKYSQVLGNIHEHPQKIEILKKIFKSVDNPTVFLGMGSSFFSTMEVESKDESSGTATLALLQFSRTLCEETGGDYDLLCKTVFAYLEKTRFRFLEAKNEVFTILEEIKKQNISLASHSLSLLLTEQPVSILTEILIFLGPRVLSEVAEYALQEAQVSRSVLFQKNTAALVLGLSEKAPVFEVLEVFIRALSSETQSIRNAAIESMVNVCAHLRREIEACGRGEKELLAVTELLCGRTWDVSLFCRARAVLSLSEIAASGSVLRGARQKVMSTVLERIEDKTHIVRKRAIVFFKRILENHPFMLDGGLLSRGVIAKYREREEEYYTDCVAFYESIQQSIATVKEILKANTRGEITEIIQYIAQCAVYGIEEALEVFPLLFALAWQRVASDGKNTTDVICEEIKRISDGDAKKLVDMMVQFDDGTLAYSGIVRELTLRGILGLGTVAGILSRMEREAEKSQERRKSLETLPLLKLIRKISGTDRSIAETCLSQVSALIATERESGVLAECVGILGNLDYRVCNSSPTIALLKETLQSVGRDNLSLLQAIIDTSYLISTEPDALAVDILEILARMEQAVPLLFAIGHVAIKEAVHLERLEAAWNIRGKPKTEEAVKKTKRDSLPVSEIRERRLSVGSRRNSLKITSEEQEEMADKVFFAKEHEMLFSEGSALYSFTELINSHLDSTDALAKKIALISLGKLMGISSEYSTKHVGRVVEILRTEEEDLKVIALMIISDSIMAFSSLVGDISPTLFAPLGDNVSDRVKITALIIIRHLLRTGMIKIKGKYWSITPLLLEKEEVSTIAQRLFEEAMERESPQKIICEVVKSYAKESKDARPNPNTDEDILTETAHKDEVFKEVLRILSKLSGLADPTKKMQEWLSTSTDESLTRVCAIAVSELSKHQRTAPAPEEMGQG
ncbi:condensin complex subunit 1 [Nematocida displodere]|uniref:Condensin complex subunit 1 n=1 Tax=Nematocida displodere TaxID=1805483 RepID=A0A177ECU9_9MICR|nr:condensin complex subunit 1 [Nematocida displodere]